MDAGRLFLDALVSGLPYTFIFLGVWLIYRLLNDFDLTVEGSFTLGAAVTAALVTYRGFNPAVATLLAGLAGAAAGLVTAAVHLRLRVPLLLAGIMTMIALYSANLRIMVLPNISFLHFTTIFSPIVVDDPIVSDVRSLLFMGLLLAAVAGGLGLFLKTDLGLSMRATGANGQMARSVGINTSLAVLLFLLLANFLVGLSGSITAQQQMFTDLNMGIGVILVGITTILIGELVVRRVGTVWLGILAVVVGTCVYYVAVSIAVRLGLAPSDLRAFTSLILLVAISSSLALGKGERWLRIRRSAFPAGRPRAALVEGAPGLSQGRSAVASGAASGRRATVDTGGLLIEGATVVYNRGQANEIVALRNLNLAIGRGEFVTIIGSNGAGKSTLVSAVAGSVLPAAGVVRLSGRDITSTPEHRRAGYVARVFQDPTMGTCPQFSIEENLALAHKRGLARGLTMAVTRRRRREFASYLEQFGLGLEDRLTEKVGRLSGGQRQALALLMAMMRTPDVLLLDEHVAALDPRNQSLLQEMTDRIVRGSGCTTLMVTHNMDNAIRYGDRMIMLHRGSVLFDLGGAQKTGLTVEKLVASFHNADSGLVTDEMLLA
jgi:putative tryptophan/tyrosine transport system ATP-binding protein